MILRPRRPSQSGRGRSDRGRRIAWLVLIVGLALSLLAWQQARQRVLEDAAARFDFRVSEITRAVQIRLRAYLQVLRGGVGMVNAAAPVSRAQWHSYVERLRLEQEFPGIQGMGYVDYLSPSEVPALERRVRAEGFADFRLWPAGEREVYSAIVYLEPFNWRNQRAFGYDMMTEPSRRMAMLQARDSGQASVTGRVVLVQETTEAPQAGFLMYLPVYAGGVLPEAIELRRQRLRGFVYAPFRMDDFMHGILGRSVPDVLLRIYDGDEPVPALLTYQNGDAAGAASAFTAVTRIDVNGKTWTLQMLSRPSLEAAILKQHEPRLVLLSGLLSSMLLFGILWGMANLQRRALRLADTMTAAFRHSEAKYGSLAQAALDAIVIADGNGRIVSWNRGASLIFGYSEQDVLGRPWTLVLPERLRDSYRRAHSLITDEGSRLLGRVLELTGVRRSGGEFPMELSLARWGSDEVFVSGIIRDVTERKRAEEALRLSEERFRVALKGADVFVFNQDRQLRYTWCYNAPRGIGGDDFVGRTDYDLFAGHPLIPLKQRVMDSGRPAHEKIELRQGAQSRYFDLVLEPVWERGMVAGLSGAAVDITALKRAEHELRASEARFRATFENAAIGIALTDIEGRLLESNPAFLRMLDHRAGALRGGQIASHMHPDDVAPALEGLAELIRGERTSFKRKTRYRTRSGGTLWASLAISLVRDELGAPTLAVHMVEDITELNAAEEALARAYADLERRVEERTTELREQTEALARSNAELEQFAYVASHDLQEPLRSVSGFAQLLERRYADKLAVDGREFIHFIVEGTARMRRLIIDLLAFSRVGAREKHFVPVEVGAVLRQVLGDLSGMLGERGAKVNHPSLPVVHGDAMDLQQLFQNLIANAVKFNRAAVPEVWVTAEEQAGEWLFAVRDNGIGIDPNFFERIFTIFQRGVRNDEYDGTGLGLAICKKVIDRHGGRIWLESAPGAGTTVYFTLQKAAA